MLDFLEKDLTLALPIESFIQLAMHQHRTVTMSGSGELQSSGKLTAR
jgi:hypothetical protein